MTPLDSNLAFTAYRKLKRHIYYDKTDLSLRAKLAEFEVSPGFNAALDQVTDIANAPEPHDTPQFKRWLREIGFRIVPKKLKSASENSDADEHVDGRGRYISNATSARNYEVEKINYFFDGPIELYLLAVIWIMKEGWRLDAALGEECFGSRLDRRLRQEEDTSAALFSKYHERYARWRDTGLKIAQRLLDDEQTSVCILGLDLQEYYYRIRINFETVAKATTDDTDTNALYDFLGDGSIKSGLLHCLEAICITYRKAIEPLIAQTHKNIDEEDVGLPIGLPASPLLANWYLRRFDRTMKMKLRPAYYGRYVDDILLVISAPEDPSKSGTDPVGNFINNTLVECGILKKPEKGVYELTNPKRLYLQQSKCILQYFDAKHSTAGLMKFKKKLEESGSDFRLLPVDEADNSLEDIAYDLLYEGSINKFRSVKGMAENRFELAKHLAKQTILHLYTDDPPDRGISKGLLKFFKGKNAIEYFDLWERVFTYFTIAGDPLSAKQFVSAVEAEVARVSHSVPIVQRLLVEKLKLHMDQSRAMADALQVKISPNSVGIAASFRKANLIRHQFVRMPLLDCTNYQGAITTRHVRGVLNFDSDKAKRSARYVAFDELLLLAESGLIELGEKKSGFEWAEACFRELHGGMGPEGIELKTMVISEEDQSDE
jgi:hypothetical protein